MRVEQTRMRPRFSPSRPASRFRRSGRGDIGLPTPWHGRGLTALTLAGVCALAVVACGDGLAPPPWASPPSTGGGGSGGSGGGPDDPYDGPCTELVLGDTSLDFASWATIGLMAPVFPPVEGLAKTRLTLELYDDYGSGTLPPIVPGTFDFGTPPDDNYGTCQHCVLLVAYDLGGHPKRAFYPRNGTMELSEVPVDYEPIVVGRAAKMELVEVVQHEDFSWEPLAGGDCFYVDEWTFDTRVVNGTPCSSAEECNNEAQQICEPQSGTCGPPQCSLTFDPPYCEPDEVCLSQLSDPDEVPSGAAIGACYPLCDPSSPASCGSGQICRPLGPTQAFGVCLEVGSAGVGESCTPRDISTECVAGAVCTGEPGECARICNFLSESSGCDDGRYCALSNLCERPTTGDPSAIGDTCASSSPELVECGIEGDAFRGLCMRFFLEDEDLVCERLCRTADPACPAGEVCLGVFSNPVVGICHAEPVCGDGILDVVGGEICDDGNTTSGDGCSGDCLQGELAELCDDAAALPLDQLVAGTTSSGISGYPSQCDPYVATQVATYSFLPPGAGRLVLSLSSGVNLGLSVYADCDDPSSELRCQSLVADSQLHVDFDVAPTVPVLVIVRGTSPSQHGPFGLSAEFIPALCGDGLVAGPEACDDGNTASNDGCSGDCLAIEWDLVCAARTPLSLTSPNQGNTDGALDLFDLSGICSYVNGGGSERAYSFTAPADGVLDLTLSQPSDNFSLQVLDGCGPASWDNYLTCSNYAPTGDEEMASTWLSAGQEVTIVVDGFRVDDAGPYVLTASFEPQ